MEARKLTPVKKKFKFGGGDLSLTTSKFNVHHVYTPEGVELDDIRDPECWVHIANMLRPMSMIFVTNEPGKYIALLYVTNCDKLWAKTEVVMYHELNSAPRATNNTLEVVFHGHKQKWGIKRKSDKLWIKTGFRDEAAAASAMANELRLMGSG